MFSTANLRAFGGFLITLLLLTGCENAEPSEAVEQAATDDTTEFVSLTLDQTGIDFANNLPEDAYRNIMRYQYFYNGGGVAIGDVNGDGLPDVCFSSNTGAPRLYLNQGGMKFREAKNAGLDLPAKATWNTGISMVDVNGDGHLDIYLCRSGNLQLANRMNLLYINKGDGTFKERAALFGLNDPGYSIQANFFDYDKDGDLDMYLANHGINFYGRDPQGKVSNAPDQYSGDKLYRNDGDRFTNVTKEAGILERAYSYGLGVGIGDLNQDGWDDIYVSNDFFEHDYLYWNQGDGTFREGIKTAARQTSYFGMGNTITDLNNDQLLDIMVVDMTAEDHYRRHANLAGLSYEKFWDFVDKGYHYQYMFNSLNINNGNATFSNQAQLAGIAQTDWSWAPLAADFNNDGLTDLYITNGLRKDVLNLDFINNIDKRFAKYIGANGQLPEDRFVEMLQTMPSEKVGNFFYRNEGDLQFTDAREQWGANTPSFSTGAAYADLDQDGDLDLVVNNIDAPAFVFENQKTEGPFLRIELQGQGRNKFGWGAKVRVTSGEATQLQQQYPIRGYQSSVEPVLHFGLPADAPVGVEVEWADGKVIILENVPPNQTLQIDQKSAGAAPPAPAPPATAFEPGPDLNQKHTENDFNDFKREFLLPHKMSALGPNLAVTDVNGDGLHDYFLGGAKGLPASLHLQKPDGSFQQVRDPWLDERLHEDGGAAFFDADGDQDMDLYVTSGGNEYEIGSKYYQDRLYLNDGKGAFTRASDALPDLRSSNGPVAAADYDGDGDVDLFVGGRQTPGAYPTGTQSYLLQNDGQGRFTDVTPQLAPEGLTGMVTDALWTDFNGDGQPDLIVVGAWMMPRFFSQSDGAFKEVTAATGLENLSGWYFSLDGADFDGDGDTDYVLGNLGLNHRFKATPEAPFAIYAADFDENGTLDMVPTYYYEGKEYPLYGRSVMQDQLVSVKKAYPSYTDYARATVQDIFTAPALAKAQKAEAQTFASLYLENKGNGRFEARPLPRPAQVSPIMDMAIDDYNGDGSMDIIIAGNLYGFEYRTARADAGNGLLMLGDGQGHFEPQSISESGIFLPGDVKALAPLQYQGKTGLLIGQNDGPLALLLLKKALQ